ncbi:LytTR family DNA-binding domain-containing protein [Anaerorhabdus sp.]|uniref:LytTR family DNA-binding domain-containing protein n=1 Tax=Anaerorhabdus sp. TaxID=1872524 RepID=UPI002FCC52C5
MKVEVEIDPSCQELRLMIITQTMNDEVQQLLTRIQKPEVELLSGFHDSGVRLIQQDEIIRIYTEDNKVVTSTKKGEYTLRLRLYECESKLDPKRFVRISNSEIINLKEVSNFDLQYSGTIHVKMKNGESTFVSRRYVSKIKKVLGI